MHVDLAPDVSDLGVNSPLFTSQEDILWISEMRSRLDRLLPKKSILRDGRRNLEFLRTVHYESLRAGLDPQWVLAVIQVESAFRKYAISTAGARGYMQVMPFWVELIGSEHHSLFDLRTNLRYGTTILRHYLDIEQGDYFRALGRYNGSLGQARYPNLVYRAWKKNWQP
ncbi:MAG: lytic transglycosylase domain-containing protein [Betaproteobacteria bacterium]|nr:lytic transglycosylase domain-containing protein [Betaproteobacteria bacterium]